MHASETKKNLTVLMQSSPKDIIRDATKKSLLETIQREFQVFGTLNPLFSPHIEHIMNNTTINLNQTIMHFRSGDFGRTEYDTTEKA